MKRTIAILGAAGWGGNWTERALRDPDVEPVAFADINPSVLDALAERGVPRDRLFESGEEALERVHSDAVTVSVPNPHRVPLLMRALAEGRHVVVDKPLVHTAEALRALLAAGEGRKSVFMVAQNYRYFAGAKRVKELLSSGDIGRPISIHAHFLRDPAAWRGRPAGRLPGVLSLAMEMCIHHVDLMRYFVGADPLEVSARGWTCPSSGIEGFTGLDFHYVFPGGVHVAYDATNAAVHSATDWCGQWQILTEGGMISYGEAERSLRAFGADGQELFLDPGPAEMPDTGQSMDRVWAAFKEGIARVEAGEPPMTTFCPLEDNAASVAMILSAAQSIAEARPVAISPRGGSVDGYRNTVLNP